MKCELIPLKKIVSPRALLREIDRHCVEYLELRASIARDGIIQSLLVRPRGDKYEIVAGNYRFDIAKALNMEEVPCTVEDLDDQAVLLLQLKENAISKKTKTSDYAERLHQIMELSDMSVEDLGFMINKSSDWIKYIMQVRRLIPAAKESLDAGKMPFKSAVTLARIPRDSQLSLLADAEQMKAVDFVKKARAVIKNYREYVRTSRVEVYEESLKEPPPRLRSLIQIHRELLSGEAEKENLKDAKTASDGWKAAIKWILSLDPGTYQIRVAGIKEKMDEHVNAVKRRKLNREILKEVENEHRTSTV